MTIWRLAAVAAVGLALTQAASADPTLYEQGWNGTNGMFASQNDVGGGNGNFATLYDNFTLNATSRVTGVQWTGGYFNPANYAAIGSFTINFYGNNAGTPGALAYTTSVSATETSLGNVGGFPMFSYSADLTTDFLADAGTEYWVSIVANLTYPPQWGLGSSATGDGNAVQDFFGARNGTGINMAFGLTGQTVPEPGSMALVALAILGLVGSSRRIAKR